MKNFLKKKQTEIQCMHDVQRKKEKRQRNKKVNKHKTTTYE